MTMIPFEAPKKTYHQHTYKDCVCNIPDVKNVGEKFLTIWSYCPECGKLRQRPSEKSWMIRTSNTIEWSKEAEREFDPETRTLPYFDIDDEWQEYIKPKKHWDTAAKLRELAAQNPPVDIFDQLTPEDKEENRLYVEERMKMSKKYIIEIEDEPFARKSALHGEEAVYRAKGFKSLVFDKVGLDKLTPMSDDIAVDYLNCSGWFREHENKISDEDFDDIWENSQDCTWDFIRELSKCDIGFLRKLYGDDINGIGDIVNRYTFSEAEEKYSAHHMRVGDEVMWDGANWIITHIDDDDKFVDAIRQEGKTGLLPINLVEKTGRRFEINIDEVTIL